MEVIESKAPLLSRKALIREVLVVFGAQLVLVVLLVQLDRIVGFGGNLHVLVGVVFIVLPLAVLDRRGRPYRRYGMTLEKPHFDLLWTLIAAVVTFIPVAIFASSVWEVAWQTELGSWRFVWPEEYPEVALSHLLVVALPEEVFYRGYLMGRLDDVFEPKRNLLGARVGWSLPIQAALFALGHFLIDFNPGRLTVFFSALAFGWLKARRRSLGAPVLFHAASNIFMQLLLAGYGR
jgi:membrane protease YdiL (CAAX protease family)